MPATLRRSRHRCASRSHLESLESRCLLSGITSYNFGLFGNANNITHDAAGNAYYADFQNIVKVSVDGNNAVSATPFALFGVNDVAYSAADDLLYFSTFNGTIGKMDTSGNILAEDFIGFDAEFPGQITVGGDGAVWFSAAGTVNTQNDTVALVGRYDFTTATATYFTMPTTEANTSDITTGADGNVYVVLTGIAFMDESYALGGVLGDSAIAKIDVGTQAVTLFDVPTPQGLILGVTTDAAGNIWYASANDSNEPNYRTENVLDLIGKITVDGATYSVTEYVIPGALSEKLGVSQLTVDDSGAVWFIESYTNRAGKLDPTTGAWNVYALPSVGGEFLTALTADGSNVWITSGSTDTVVRIDLANLVDPIVATNPDLSAIVNTPFTDDVALFASDAAGDFSYTIDYGNGVVISGTLTNNVSGLYYIPGNVTYVAVGEYATRLTITSAAGDVISLVGTAVVEEGSTEVPFQGQAINLSAQEDVAIVPNVVGYDTLVVATFSGTGAYTATVNFGDGELVAAEVVEISPNQYIVKLAAGTSKIYATQGVYTVTTVITNGTDTLTLVGTATVQDTPLVASQNLILAANNGRVLNGTLAYFSDDFDLTKHSFRAVINWGDGNTEVGKIHQLGAGSFTVFGNHKYRTRGVFLISIQITNLVENTSATATATVTV